MLIPFPPYVDLVIPGAIDNRHIARFPRRLISQIDRNATSYCSLRRNLWHFLYSIYGGGPVVAMGTAHRNEAAYNETEDGNITNDSDDNEQ